jgi:NAD(P)-dependent dehydrogenase (short-subunit alcohol dehydrogenase family)
MTAFGVSSRVNDVVTRTAFHSDKQEFIMTDSTRIAVVTGAYRGLGLETCRQLAGTGIRVILTARTADKAEASARTLQVQGLDVEPHVLDVTGAVSVNALAHYLEEKYGRLDILVNNAGIFVDTYPPAEGSSVFDADFEKIRKSMETNAYGALRVACALIPLMKGSGAVVNVSSGMGQLSDMNGCCPGYRLSKTALNAVTRILADELRHTAVKVNSVCPGWVRTHMGGENAERSVEEGAAGIVWAACLSDDGPSGGFFRDGKAIPW